VTWREQADRIRELNAKCIETIGARIDADQISDEDVGMLCKLSAIAKAWAAEERHDSDKGDGDKASAVDDRTLMRAVPR
jgi:hypothetical protein